MRIVMLLLLVAVNSNMFAQTCETIGWDAALTRDLNAIKSSAVTRSSQIVSDALYPLGIGVPAALYLAGVLNVFDDRCSASPNAARAGVQIGTTMAAATAITLGLKQAFDRKRPYQAYPECITNRASDSDPSFPSGHSAGSAALATSLSLVYPQWYVIVPSVGYALWTGFARMNLGMHYITDVMAGYAVGVGTALLVHAVREHLFSVADPLLPDADCTRLGSLSVVPTTNIISLSFGF